MYSTNCFLQYLVIKDDHTKNQDLEKKSVSTYILHKLQSDFDLLKFNGTTRLLQNSSLVNLPLGSLDKVCEPPSLDSEHSDWCVGRRGLGDVEGAAHLRHPTVE